MKYEELHFILGEIISKQFPKVKNIVILKQIENFSIWLTFNKAEFI